METSKTRDFTDSSSCTLVYDEENQWIRAIWRGYIGPGEATEGATDYLHLLEKLSSPYLLNDNSAIDGPWFDSVDWLVQTWLPRATKLGLRYVAHVMPAGGHDVLYPGAMPQQDAMTFELQIFDRVAEAEQWLRSCKREFEMSSRNE